MVIDMRSFSGNKTTRQALLLPLALVLFGCGGPSTVSSDLGRVATGRILERVPQVSLASEARTSILRGPIAAEETAVARAALVIVCRADDTTGPAGFSETVAPAFKGRVAVSDATTCPAGFVLAAAISQHYGWGWFERLRRNQTKVLPDQDAVVDAILSKDADIGIIARDAIPPDSPLRVINPRDGIIQHPVHVVGPDPDGVIGAAVKAAVTSPTPARPYPFAAKAQQRAAAEAARIKDQFRRLMFP